MAASLSDKLDLARFFRGIGPESGPVTLDRRRVYILPTRSGVIFAVILFAMLLGAINYSNSLAFALTFLLFGVGVMAILHTYRNLTGLQFQAGHAPPAFAGEGVRFGIGVRNHSALDRFAVTLQHTGTDGVTVDVPANTLRWVELEVKSTRRGRLPMGRFTISTLFPFGLLRAWSHLDLDMAAVVYPRPGDDPRLPAESPEIGSTGGERGRGMDDFSGLRGYAPGDSLRHVHWKALAREQGLMTKQFSGGETAQLWLSWELLPGRDVESRLSQLCRWVLEADRQAIAYGLALPDRQIRPNLGSGHRQRCLEALALFGESDGGS